MKLTIEIEIDGPAFAERKCGPELARILKELTNRVEGWSYSEMPRFSRSIYDSNCNNCGHARVSDEYTREK